MKIVYIFFNSVPGSPWALQSKIHSGARILICGHLGDNGREVARHGMIRTAILPWGLEDFLWQWYNLKLSGFGEFLVSRELGYRRWHENRYLKSKPALSELVQALRELVSTSSTMPTTPLPPKQKRAS